MRYVALAEATLTSDTFTTTKTLSTSTILTTGGWIGTFDTVAYSSDINGTSGVDYLYGTSGQDWIYGKAGNDFLYGLDHNDTLDGGLGADVMVGGTGNDTYFVDNAGDIVWEWGGEGWDTVYASIDYTLPPAVEALRLTGSTVYGLGNEEDNAISGNAADNILYGFDGRDSLSGDAGNDRLEGGLGDDWLDGGLGFDTMIGGPGNDSYYVDTYYEPVIEQAGEGIDSVSASVRYTLPDAVENLYLTGVLAIDGTGNALDNILHGNDYANTLSGLAGNDTIGGGVGDDVLIGGTGRDWLTGNDGADRFVWNSTNETSTTLAAMDWIQDFSSFEGDRIDLSGVDANVYAAGDQAFTFIGNAPFSGAPGEINYVYSGGNTIIQMQTGTSPDVEGGIVLPGLQIPQASWFVL
jgi:Ca2+-binding RTX toxin-like protein